MSVRITNLTKEYGQQKAIDSISFSANKGEILGFLGPNGAGKTTTMKIISCFIPQTSGDVEVCGMNTKEHAFEIRKKIGYLPEHNPLYHGMYVKEYLSFVAGLHKLPNKKQSVQDMIEKTGLVLEQNKRIGALSKGYKQRVGLAQALIHDPEVLILDEPISGLDPNQLIEIRLLIKSLGSEKTVIFSSHIMQEVQALCDRIIIIDQGKLAAEGSIDTLVKRSSDDYLVTVEFNKPVSPKQLGLIDDAIHVESVTEKKFTCRIQTQNDIRHLFFQFAVDNQLTLLELHKKTPTVEDLFQKVTR